MVILDTILSHDQTLSARHNKALGIALMATDCVKLSLSLTLLH